jgi:hypothetical protein
MAECNLRRTPYFNLWQRVDVDADTNVSFEDTTSIFGVEVRFGHENVPLKRPVLTNYSVTSSKNTMQ